MPLDCVDFILVCKCIPYTTFLTALLNILLDLREKILYTLHFKNAWLFQPKFGSNMDKAKCWFKNLI